MSFIDHTLQKMLMTKDRYGTHDGGKWLRSSNCLPLTNGRIQTCPGYSFTKQPNLQTLTTKLHVGALPLGHQAFDKLDDVNLMMLCWSMHPEYQGAPPLKKHPVQGTRDHFFMC
ncbi:hypothetical protein BDA96_01G047700 [Sorghum bicolor]|uniref:Uncharacterized protein n=1 Tax=Sorghum bicolor TaxID=4558 RepID=A0A921RWU8_SORBI|nr:hypothetical protein BDA96_01G047700 [Sorghum bicolor]